MSQGSGSGFDIGNILPATKAEYKNFLKGISYKNFAETTLDNVTPSPAYTDARATIARGLVAALPDDAYSTSSQTQNSQRSNKTECQAGCLCDHLPAGTKVCRG